MNIDEMQDIRDDIAEQVQDREEIQDYFADMAKEGNDELEGELDALVAEAAMDDIQIGDGVIQPSAATMAQN